MENDVSLENGWWRFHLDEYHDLYLRPAKDRHNVATVSVRNKLKHNGDYSSSDMSQMQMEELALMILRVLALRGMDTTFWTRLQEDLNDARRTSRQG